MKDLSGPVVSEIICLVLLLATGIAVLIGASQLPAPMFDPLGPAGLPRYIGWFIVVLTVLRSAVFVRGLSSSTEPLPSAKKANLGSFVIAVAITLIYLLALTFGGFPFPYLTLVFLSAMGVTLSDRSPKSLVIVGVIAVFASFGLTYLFTDVLKIILPE